MSEPYWTLVQCWTNIGPIQKHISPTVALEAKTGQMSDAQLSSTALTKIGPIKTTLELHWTIFLVGSMLTQRRTNVLHRFYVGTGGKLMLAQCKI